MLPIIPSSMSYYTGSSAGYTGSSPYAIPDQPPFYDLTRAPRRPSNSYSHTSRPSISTRQPRPTSISSNSGTSSPPRKGSIFSVRSKSSSASSRSSLRRSSSSLLSKYNSAGDDLSRSSSTDSTTTSSSLGGSIKSFFRGSVSMTREEKEAKKALKMRRKQVERAEMEAYKRAQDMEATAMYAAWSMF